MKVSVTRGSQELSRKKRRTRIYELLYFIPSAVLKQLTLKQLENKLVAHRCAICEKVFRLSKGNKAHKEDAHEKERDQAASPSTPVQDIKKKDNQVSSPASTAIKTVTPTTPVTKRRPKHRLLRERPAFSYNDNFYCDYECGFSTISDQIMSNHIKTHHAERATTKIKDLEKICDENGNIDLPRQQRSSDLDLTDETIPEPKVFKSQVSCIQEAGNKTETEEIIIISDDEEEVATPKTTETDRNCREFMSSVVCSTTPKATNVSYEDSVAKEQGYLFSTGRQLDDKASRIGKLVGEKLQSRRLKDEEKVISSYLVHSDGESDSAEDMSDKHAEDCDFKYMSDKEDEEFDTVIEISDTEENKDDKSQDLDSDKDDIMESYMLVNGILYEIAD